MSAVHLLILVIVILLVVSLPSWPYSQNWGIAPSGGLGLLLVIIVILMLLGRI